MDFQWGILISPTVVYAVCEDEMQNCCLPRASNLDSSCEGVIGLGLANSVMLWVRVKVMVTVRFNPNPNHNPNLNPNQKHDGMG